MKVLSYAEAATDLAKALDTVIDDAEETVIHRADHEDVVLVSLTTWSSIQETEYLLRDPANAAMLRAAIRELDEGRGVEHSLSDPAVHGPGSATRRARERLVGIPDSVEAE